MEAELVSRAMTAATSVAGALDLRVSDEVVIHNSNKLALRLLPCDVFARVALAGQESPHLRSSSLGGSLTLRAPSQCSSPGSNRASTKTTASR
jgi:hypothetical protein